MVNKHNSTDGYIFDSSIVIIALPIILIALILIFIIISLMPNYDDKMSEIKINGVVIERYYKHERGIDHIAVLNNENIRKDYWLGIFSHEFEIEVQKGDSIVSFYDKDIIKIFRNDSLYIVPMLIKESERK